LLVKCFHVGLTCIKLVNIGIEAAIMTFGIAIRDVDIDKHYEPFFLKISKVKLSLLRSLF